MRSVLFDTIEANKVARSKRKTLHQPRRRIYWNISEKGRIHFALPDLTMLPFLQDGTSKVTHIQEKLFVGETEKSKAENHKRKYFMWAVFKRNDKRTIYNVIYRDGKRGTYFMKRFNIPTCNHDHEYDLTKGKTGSRVVYFSANPNGEAEIVKVMLKPEPGIKKLSFDINFANLAIKGRASFGNIVSKNAIYRIALKSKGGSTLGGRKVWFDPDVQRINYDERGTFLGEFGNNDRVLVITKNGESYTTDFDSNNHYENDILYIGKYDADFVWSFIFLIMRHDGHPYSNAVRWILPHYAKVALVKTRATNLSSSALRPILASNHL